MMRSVDQEEHRIAFVNRVLLVVFFYSVGLDQSFQRAIEDLSLESTNVYR